MVSTSGIKYKFSEGERVLCYEPDPTKAKVLYDSKVLEVVVNKDIRGRKNIEYLIHFQGWNSSWDRCVAEEFVLKDTLENRQLQKDLAEKSQLQLGAYLYRKERKKHSRKTSDRTEPSSEDGSSGSPAHIDTDDNNEMTSSEDSSIEDESIEIELTPDLREILESDYYFINKKNRLHKLPAEPNVATILESYYRQYATNQICCINEKPNPRYRHLLGNIKLKPEDIQRNLRICREVMDGLRVYFDHTLNDLLLYGPEKDQILTKPAIAKPPGTSEVKTETKNEASNLVDSTSHSRHSNNHFAQNGNSSTNSRRRTLRSSFKVEQTNGVSTTEENNGVCHSKPSSSVSSSSSPDISGPLAKELNWKLLADHVYSQRPPPPCLVYGAIHLTRLFVKLPDLLISSTIPENKIKVLLQHLDMVIEFLNEHKEWYGERYYHEAQSN